MTIVLVHGGWQGAAAWNQVKVLLRAQGHTVFAEDLPGSGCNARLPHSYSERPLNQEAFATEYSPNASVTQDQRTQAVITLIEKATLTPGSQVLLVGHSINGLTITDVAEAMPERLSAVVYLGAVLASFGKTLAEITQHPVFSNAAVNELYMANPAEVGALRIDFKSNDPTYVAQIRRTFYADVTDADFRKALNELYCDEPYSVSLVPSRITRERFGRVPRHYIRTLHDESISLAGQDFMIDATDHAMGNRTVITSIGSSHSPFISQPALLAEMIVKANV